MYTGEPPELAIASLPTDKKKRKRKIAIHFLTAIKETKTSSR